MPEAIESLSSTIADQGKIGLLSNSPEPSQDALVLSNVGTVGASAPASQTAGSGTDLVKLDAGESASREELESAQTFEMQFSLAEIAHATDLREDDVAFALIHSGLANFRSPIPPSTVASTGTEDQAEHSEAAPISSQEMQIVVTAAIVEDVATKFKVKQQPVLSKLHCLF